MTANEWLAENGICIAQLLKAENELIQSKKIAQFLIKHVSGFLEPKERAVLSQFLEAMSIFSSRRKISSRHARKIMSICKSIIQKLLSKSRA